MSNTFFNAALAAYQPRIATTNTKATLLLDKNEQTADVSARQKFNVVQQLMQEDWNRYPAADLSCVEEKVADYCGLEKDNIVLAAGSASLVTVLLNYFALSGKRIIINQPSYSLFEYHCNTYNIPFVAWQLNEDLQFDVEALPALTNNDVVIITSPNNPVGNAIQPNELRNLLLQNPQSLFVLDAVYCEFAEHNFTPLVNEFSNLLVLRSFSKAFPVAGIRIGYLCAQAAMVAAVKKLVLPFSLNHFAIAFAKEVLFTESFLQESRDRVVRIISERERLYRFMQVYFDETVVKVFPSQGNFLLVKITDTSLFDIVMKAFCEAGIKVLNTSNFSLLEQTFRVSIGSAEENDCFLDCLVQTVNNVLLPLQEAA